MGQQLCPVSCCVAEAFSRFVNCTQDGNRDWDPAICNSLRNAQCVYQLKRSCLPAPSSRAPVDVLFPRV
uniref:Uncharacterized protein n=1 Tax=Anopheles christyi TaxID=43041 RepID=A0A182KID5_9DIPT